MFSKVITPVPYQLDNGSGDLKLWLDASDTSTIVSSGGLVSQWYDKSGNGYIAQQLTGSNQPTTGTNTINGLNVLNYNQDVMITTTTVFNTSLYTLFAVLEPTVDGVDFIGTGGTTVSNILLMNFANAYRIHYWTSGGDNLYDLFTYTSTPSLFMHQVNTTNVLAMKNGVVGIDTALEGTKADTEKPLHIGARGTSGLFVGNFAEILIFSSVLSTSQIENINTYLNNKWKLY